MYSTKQLENILLAELSRTQYDTFMETVRDSTDLSYKEIKNVRNSETFRKVFGNKQRIWIPLDISEEIETSTDKYLEYENIFKRYNSNELDRYLINTILTYVDLWRIYGFESNKEAIVDKIQSLEKAKLVLLWIKGYVTDGKRITKIGSHINKLLSIIKKSANNTNNTVIEHIEKLQDILQAFNSRDTDPRLPKELYAAGRSVPDEAVFGRTIKKDKLYICISRYPADVAAMSTRQGWRSCQNLDMDDNNTIAYNMYNWHVKWDIALGTCVAYLITESNIRKSKERQNVPNEYDDKFKGKDFIPKTSLFPILSPIARILIKPFYGIDKSNVGQLYLSIGNYPSLYGDNTYYDVLVNITREFIESRQSDKNGKFKIPNELYNESIGAIGRSIANTLVVKNGKIVDIAGFNRMLNEEPIKLNKKDKTNINNTVDEIVSNVENLRQYGIVLGGEDITGKFDYKFNENLVFIDVNIINSLIKGNSFDTKISFETQPRWLESHITDILSNKFKKNNAQYTSYLANYLRDNNLQTKIEDFCNQDIFSEYNNNPVLVERTVIEYMRKIEVIKNVTLNLNTFEDIQNITFSPYIYKQVTNNVFIFCNISLILRELTDKDFITSNTYTSCEISLRKPVLSKIKENDFIYFVGDKFFKTRIMGDSDLLKQVRFIDCKFNGEKIDGEAKIVGINEIESNQTIRLNMENIEKI